MLASLGHYNALLSSYTACTASTRVSRASEFSLRSQVSPRPQWCWSSDIWDLCACCDSNTLLAKFSEAST
eukprot:6486926-Amphidinium_carterae.2